MPFKIKINDKCDDKLLQNFPNDPYSDIVIITTSSKLQLSLAYLSIDSSYFANISSEHKQIDLSHLPQQPLIYVIRALYGGQLFATTLLELQQYYKIVQELQIQEFKTTLISSILDNHLTKKQSSLFNSIQMIEFCLKNEILVKEVTEYHFQNKLKILESSKNYLQLAKLSEKSLNFILLKYSDITKQSGDMVINHILENYFNRKSIKPNEYLNKQQLIPLKIIWEKYHHKLAMTIGNKIEKKSSAINPRLSEDLIQSQLTKQLSLDMGTNLCTSSQINQENLLDLRIKSLMKDLEIKNKKIDSLEQQLYYLKQKKNAKNNQKDQEIDDQFTFVKSMTKSRKSKEERASNQDKSTNEVAYENVKKAIQTEKEGKIKLVSSRVSSTKKIFN